MARENVKTVSRAYLLALVGVAFGIIGLHRFYLRCYVSATIMTVLYIAGIFVFVWEIIVRYHSLIEQLAASLSIGGGIDYGNIPDLTQTAQPTGGNLIYGYIALGISGAWLLIDLFLIPSMVKQCNKEYGLG